MSAALGLPIVWATAAPLPETLQVGEQRLLVRGRAFYRSYTETILRRYSKMSMEAGRVSSLLGRELFRGDVTSYKVHSFDDVVIFVHDVEKCLAKLDNGQQIDRADSHPGVLAGGGGRDDGAQSSVCAATIRRGAG